VNLRPIGRPLRFHGIPTICVVSLACFFAAASTKPLQEPETFPQIESIVDQAIGAHEIPGAVVLVGHDGRVIYRRAFGWRSLEPRIEPMTTDTIFDLASLTKVVATTTSVMRLVERGQIRLDDPVMRYIPEFGTNGKQYITVRDLLTHHSGLAPDIDLNRIPNDYRAALQVAFDEKPLIPPGARFIYSDTNFIVLGALVGRVSGMSLDRYAKTHIFVPLGMTHTRFLPPASWVPKIAPTQYDEVGVMLRGVVHDPRARRMGGIAGHAGLFSTADDLAKFAQALLNGHGVLSRKTIEMMTKPQQPPTSTALRGFGWDIDSPLSSNRGELFPIGSFGHTGWTGTSLWIDPITNSYVIILSNSVHPNGTGNAVALRSKIATTVSAYLPLTRSEERKLRLRSITGYNETNPSIRNVQPRTDVVETGLDMLEAQDFSTDIFRSNKAKRIGILTSTGNADSEGHSTIDVLAHAPGVALKAVFFISPFGNRSTLQNPTTSNAQPAETDIHVFALQCGNATDVLPLDIFEKLDALIVDLQDSGTTTHSCLKVVGSFLQRAASAGIDMLVLDRPNPINGSIVQGPSTTVALDDGSEDQYSIPIRHGMTIGEIAQLLNSELRIGAKLSVIPMRGWTRSDWFDSTSLMWTDPSADIRNLLEAMLYSGMSLLEGSNVSIGRGTGMPFQLVGAPWINAREFTSFLNARRIDGVRFIATKFTPSSELYAGQECSGVDIVVLDRNALDAPELALEVASALRQLYPAEFEIGPNAALMIPTAVRSSMPASASPMRITNDWQISINQFDEVRKRYLLYK